MFSDSVFSGVKACIFLCRFFFFVVGSFPVDEGSLKCTHVENLGGMPAEVPQKFHDTRIEHSNKKSPASPTSCQTNPEGQCAPVTFFEAFQNNCKPCTASTSHSHLPVLAVCLFTFHPKRILTKTIGNKIGITSYLLSVIQEIRDSESLYMWLRTLLDTAV